MYALQFESLEISLFKKEPTTQKSLLSGFETSA